MVNDKKIEFLEDELGMDITITWFSPMAFFLAFFTIIWCGFLVFFYSVLLGSGAPIFAALFPLIHVGVGIYLAYYTLCLFLNKTYIHLYNDELNILHQPIPWIGGNKRLKKSEITQLYVKEKVSNSKNGPRYKYHLMAQLRSGADQKILALDDLSSDRVQEIERRLEQYMGIPNQRIAGEYVGRSHREGTDRIQQRQHHRLHFSNPVFQSLFLAKAGDNITYKNEPLRVAAITQYDWHDGNSDKLLQCFTEVNTEFNLYVYQQQAVLKVYQVRRLMDGQLLEERFHPDRPFRTMELDKTAYILDSSSMGNSFNTFSNGHTETRQWLYISSDQQSMVRVLDQQGQITYYQGQVAEDHHFEQVLDLNQEPSKKKITNRRDRTDDDFV